MYHAHRYSKASWAGEAEIDPTQEYEEREAVDGWELMPVQCLRLAYDAVMQEKAVLAGMHYHYVLYDRVFKPHILGSSTACIINLNASSGVLRAAK